MQHPVVLRAYSVCSVPDSAYQKWRADTDLGPRQHQLLWRLDKTLLEDLLCLILPLPPVVVHVVFVDFEIRVRPYLGKPPVLCLAMLDNQMASEPITVVEPEAWMKSLHLLIVSEWRRHTIRLTFSTMRPY